MNDKDYPIAERKYIDATPDEEYAIRILKAYRKDCDYIWSSSSDNITHEPLIEMLNDAQKKRAEILDKAILLLEGAKASGYL